MGYFANGLVFTAEPDFAAVAATMPNHSFAGYKHHDRPVWLLDVWRPRGKLRLRHAPFCDPAADELRADLTVADAPTREFLHILRRLTRGADVECRYVRLALAVAAAARCPAFLFAADDEELDLGCQAAPGSLVSFGCRLDRMAVYHRAGRTTVTPLDHAEDNDADAARDVAARVEGVTLLPARDIESSPLLYENPVAEWPADAGDPAETLGLGTWDPLANVDRDFAMVFEYDRRDGR